MWKMFGVDLTFYMVTFGMVVMMVIILYQLSKNKLGNVQMVSLRAILLHGIKLRFTTLYL